MSPRRGAHPAFTFLAVISLLITAIPAFFMFVGYDGVNPSGVIWVLWGGFWTVLWWLFARGRR